MRRLLIALACATPLAAQQPTFTAQDLLAVRTWQVLDLSDDGRWLLASTATRRDGLGGDFTRDTDPTYVGPNRAQLWVVETATGARRALFPAVRRVRSATLSPDGARVGFIDVAGDRPRVVLLDRATLRETAVALPPGQYVAENSDLRWLEEGSALGFTVRTETWRRDAQAEFARLTVGPVTAMSSAEPFLAWEALRRRGAVASVARYDVATRRVTTLVPDGMVPQWRVSADGRVVVWGEDITPRTDYDVIFGAEVRLKARDGAGVERTLFPTTKGWTIQWSDDGLRWAASREGRVYVGTPTDTVRRLVLGPAEGAAASTDTSATARRQRARERFSVLRVSDDGGALLAQNGEGIWWVDPAAPAARVLVADTEDTVSAPRVSVTAWSRDARHVYLSVASRETWRRGIVRWDRQTARADTLVMDGRLYQGVRLAARGDVAALAIADGNRPADLWVGDAALGGLRRVVEANPGLAAKLGRTELVQYRDVDGVGRFGVVHFPVGYREGTKYPTVFLVYESFFDDTYDATANLLAGHGYVVVKPSVGFETGYPGEAWLKGVTAAANGLIESGIADSSRLGVQGTSYGGYATNLIVTQTHRFAAAINVSGKVDIISFYTDSPRLGVRNVHAAEKSQDRIGATLWQAPLKYVAHSAVMAADRIRTPLLLMTGGEDHNVPALNTREMFYALRRLGKTVEWVDYRYGGHGVPTNTEANFLDWHQRVVAWYDRYLKRAGPVEATQGR
jgi:dipeptidyl aminopeptidase/acylaminoacyl peptidase